VTLWERRAEEPLQVVLRLVDEANSGGHRNETEPVAADPQEGAALAEPVKKPRVSVTLTNLTLLDALNALVVAHGALTWRLSWCGGPQDAAHAQLELIAFSGDTMTVAGRECRP
jgi:hypothetical protein